jgi:hypothetical protein
MLLCGVFGIGGFLAARGSSSAATTQAPAAVAPANPRASRAAPVRPQTKPTPNATRGGSHRVVYEVTGEGSAFITFATANGISQSQAKLPWSKEVTVGRNAFAISVLAFQLTGNKVSCRVLLDGTEVAKEGPNRAASCNHLITD